MLIREYLQTGGSLESLLDKYGISSRRHVLYNNLVLLSYNQISSPMHEHIVRECRGLILDEAEDWRVISRPFDKFFNYGEPNASKIDWSTAVVQEKLDGSLAILYWYEGKWHVSTSGSPDAGGNVGDLNFTFKDLFWRTFEANKLNLPNHNMVDFNFMFELMTPYNRIIVRHSEPKLALIGIRNRFSGQEFSVSDSKFTHLNYPTVRSFPLNNIDDILKSFDSIDGLAQEGYVVVDKTFNRNKIKHPQYVAVHHLKGNDGPSFKRILDIVRTGEGAEVLSYFPEWSSIFDEVKLKFNTLVSELESDYKRITEEWGALARDLQTQKEFAARATKTKCADVLFKLKAGKEVSVRQYLAKLPVDKLLSIMGR